MSKYFQSRHTNPTRQRRPTAALAHASGWYSFANRARPSDRHIELAQQGDQHRGESESEGAAGDEERHERVGGLERAGFADKEVGDRIEDGDRTDPGGERQSGGGAVA